MQRIQQYKPHTYYLINDKLISYISIYIYAYLKWKTTIKQYTLTILSSFFFSNLRSQVEPQASELLHSVFNDQGSISWHGQDNLVRQVRCFIEQVQVSKSEWKGNWLIDFQNSGIILLFTLISLDSDATTTDFSTDGELDRFLGSLNSDYAILINLNFDILISSMGYLYILLNAISRGYRNI